jgi:hypothetical protein
MNTDISTYCPQMQSSSRHVERSMDSDEDEYHYKPDSVTLAENLPVLPDYHVGQKVSSTIANNRHTELDHIHHHLQPFMGAMGMIKNKPQLALISHQQNDSKRDEASSTTTASWICCDACSKWRRVPRGIPLPNAEVEWRCELNTWDRFNQCSISEEVVPNDELLTEDGLSNEFEDDGIDEAMGREGVTCSMQELKYVRTELQPESIWALPNSRLLCWIEDRPYAVAHEGETLPDISREFQVEVRTQ